MVRNNLKSALWLFFGIFLGLGVIIAAPTSASAASVPSGISLSPFLQQVTIQPTDVQKTFTLTLTNHTKNVQELNLSSKDFGSLNDTGGVILEGSKTYSQKYGLASWLSLEKDTVVLAPNESATVLATIENRSSLQPGGHYGAIVASVNNFNQPSGNDVAINQQLLSLVLADKVGGERYDLKLAGIQQNGNWFHLPNTVRLRFHNPGNVHVIPRGVVRLKSPTGTVVAQGIINSESAYVLPESFRQLYVPLTRVGKAIPLPGLYHVEVEYRYDGLNRTATKSYVVHFIDAGLYIAGLLVVVIIWQVILRRKKPANSTASKK